MILVFCVDAAEIANLWNQCKSSWTLQPYRHIAFNDLTFGKSLGVGTFGQVKQGLWKRGYNDYLDVAIKIIPESFQFDLNDLRSEFVALSLLSHPNVVSMHGGGHIAQNLGNLAENCVTWYIVMELMRGSLSDLIYRNPAVLTQEYIFKLCLDIAKGMSFMHNCSITEI
jgi:serine/threonine protein kinase